MILRFTDGRPSLIVCDMPDCGESVEFREPENFFDMMTIVDELRRGGWSSIHFLVPTSKKEDRCPGHKHP